MKKPANFLLIAAIALIIAQLQIALAVGNVDYDFKIGADQVQQFGPAITKAPNGDTIELVGEGIFSTKPKAIAGGGTFIHRDLDGIVIDSGIWVAKSLITFRTYGSGALQGFPENFEGGRALVRIELMPDDGSKILKGILRISSVLGNFPKNAKEGIKLSVHGSPIKFNMEQSGAALFVRHI